MTPIPQTVLLADDHPLITQGLRQSLEATQHFQVIAECRDGQAALQQIRLASPQLAVLDIDMPQLDGFRVAELLAAEHLPVKVAFLTVHNEPSFLRRALQVGAQGYILKDTAPADIVAGLQAVCDNQVFISPALVGHLVGQAGSASEMVGPPGQLTADLTSLTATERTVLTLIGECRTTKEIAERLFISPRTVETHRSRICKKLGLRGNHALTKYAIAYRSQL